MLQLNLRIIEEFVATGKNSRQTHKNTMPARPTGLFLARITTSRQLTKETISVNTRTTPTMGVSRGTATWNRTRVVPVLLSPVSLHILAETLARFVTKQITQPLTLFYVVTTT